jgi:hypothetical protein
VHPGMHVLGNRIGRYWSLGHWVIGSLGCWVTGYWPLITDDWVIELLITD